jgi:hypothetical protein
VKRREEGGERIVKRGHDTILLGGYAIGMCPSTRRKCS